MAVTTDETVRGTELTAGSDIALQAGYDVNLTAAKAYTDTGSVSVAAGNDVNLLAVQEQHDAEQHMQKKKKGFLSTTTHDEWHDSTAVATSGSTTKSDIAAGTVEVRNGETAALSGLDRKATELQQSGLKEIFDEKKLAEQKELAAVAKAKF